MLDESLTSFPLSRRDVGVMKGIAIIAMLLHHVYGFPPHFVDSVSVPKVLHCIGLFGKVCVAIFVFCSGYGLAAQYKGGNLEGGFGERLKYNLRFLARRLAKFYANYWFVFLVFVPITIFCFGKSTSLRRLFIDWLGLGGYGAFNITWWFNTLIICLYALFPLFYAGCKKYLPLTLALCLAGGFIWGRVNLAMVSGVMLFSFPFALGIAWAQRPDWLVNCGFSSLHSHWQIAVATVLLAIFTTQRLTSFIPWLSGVRIDGFISLSLAIVLVSLRSLPLSRLWAALAFLGKHSANIYLIHTFFNDLWRPVANWIHGNFHGCWNFVVLFAICLLVSVALEWVKKLSRYNLLAEKVVKVLK